MVYPFARCATLGAQRRAGRSEQGQDKVTALVPVAQRRVEVLDGDEVLAVRAEDGSIYLPPRPICASLGLSYQPQRRRV